MKKNDRSCSIENCKTCFKNINKSKYIYMENQNYNDNDSYNINYKNICLMCNEGFFYYKNNCLKKCTFNTIELDNNNICIDKISSCEVNNCQKCGRDKDIYSKYNNNIISKCLKCLHGLYLYENKCYEICPIGTRANRINFTCTNKSSKKI
jgi:hypothetical protein